MHRSAQIVTTSNKKAFEFGSIWQNAFQYLFIFFDFFLGSHWISLFHSIRVRLLFQSISDSFVNFLFLFSLVFFSGKKCFVNIELISFCPEIIEFSLWNESEKQSRASENVHLGMANFSTAHRHSSKTAFINFNFIKSFLFIFCLSFSFSADRGKRIKVLPLKREPQ